MATSEVEETMKRIAGHKGVEAVLVYTNSEEIPVRSQPVMEHMDMVHYVGQIAPLIKQVRRPAPSSLAPSSDTARLSQDLCHTHARRSVGVCCAVGSDARPLCYTPPSAPCQSAPRHGFFSLSHVCGIANDPAGQGHGQELRHFQ